MTLKYILKVIILMLPLFMLLVWLGIAAGYFLGREGRLLVLPVYFFIWWGYSKLLDKLGAW